MRQSALLVPAVSLLLLAGCSSPSPTNVLDESLNSPPASASPSASQVPDWYEEEVAAVSLGELPSSLESYAQMSVEEFASLPKAEQWVYALWLTKNRDAFMELFYKYHGQVQIDKPVVLSESSSATEVFSSLVTYFRMAMASPEGGQAAPVESGPSGKLDEDAAAKILVATHANLEQAQSQLDLIVKSTKGDAPSVAMLGLGDAFDISDLPIISDTASKAEFSEIPSTKREIVYQDRAGESRQINIFIYPINTYDGRTEVVCTLDNLGLFVTAG